MLRAVFDRIEWSSWVELILAVGASSLAAALLAPYLNDEKKRKHGIVLSGMYAFILVGFLLFLKGKNKDAIQLTDVWATKESDGENFVMDFFRKDSVLLIFGPNDERVVGYSWEKNRLRLYDEEGNLLFDWTIKLESDKFTLRQGEDELIFYKQ